jgi:Zn-dependent protease with chaperone function
MLLNLLMPVMHNYLTPKPYVRLHTLVSGLVIIGAFWASAAVYFYYAIDYPKATGAFVSGVVSLLAALAISLFAYYTRKKVANTALDTAIREVGPVVSQVYALLNTTKVKMALPLAALAAGFMMVKGKK